MHLFPFCQALGIFYRSLVPDLVWAVVVVASVVFLVKVLHLVSLWLGFVWEIFLLLYSTYEDVATSSFGFLLLPCGWKFPSSRRGLSLFEVCLSS